MKTRKNHEKTKITWIMIGLITTLASPNAENAGADTWTRKADMPTPRWAHAIAVVNNKIYAIGGMATDTWTRKADMPDGMAATKGYGDASPPVVDGRVYLIGGGSTGTARTDIYDPVADAWTRGADMPTRRNNTATAVWNDKIYVFGGIRL